MSPAGAVTTFVSVGTEARTPRAGVKSPHHAFRVRRPGAKRADEARGTTAAGVAAAVGCHDERAGPRASDRRPEDGVWRAAGGAEEDAAPLYADQTTHHPC